MPDLTTVYNEIINRHLVPSTHPTHTRSGAVTYTDDFQKVEQALGNTFYTAAYAMGHPSNVNKLEKAIQTSVIRRFYPYVNMTARRDPRAYWHLYDGNHIGDSAYALFGFQAKKTGASRFNLGVTFRPAKIMTPLTAAQKSPGPTGRTVKKSSVFYNKAMVMEYGLPTTIAPKHGKFLVFEGRTGHLVFTPKTIEVNRSWSPTRGSLRGVVNRFFVGGPGETASHMVAQRYADETARLSSMASVFEINVMAASDSKAKAVASTIGRKVGNLEV